MERCNSDARIHADLLEAIYARKSCPNLTGELDMNLGEKCCSQFAERCSAIAYLILSFVSRVLGVRFVSSYLSLFFTNVFCVDHHRGASESQAGKG